MAPPTPPAAGTRTLEHAAVPMGEVARLIAGMDRRRAHRHGVALIVEAVELGGGPGEGWSLRDLAMALVALRETLCGGKVPGFALAPSSRHERATDWAARAGELAPRAGDEFRVLDMIKGGSGKNTWHVRRTLRDTGLFRLELRARRGGGRGGRELWAVRIEP